MLSNKFSNLKWLMSILMILYVGVGYAFDLSFLKNAYIGVSTGYGATTWSGLVPNKLQPGDAMLMSTPVYVREGGLIWGVTGGYELIPNFAIEGNYTRWPDAAADFDQDSLFAFEHDGQTHFRTHTETAGVLAKFMFYVPHTRVRAFSSAGAAGTHRYDQLADRWHVNPSFGVGVNYMVARQLMMEFGADYTAGYAQSEIDPSLHYVPFLYSGFMRISYFLA